MTHHDVLLARILGDGHEDRVAERALSEHLDSLILLHGACRACLLQRRGASCLERLFMSPRRGAWYERRARVADEPEAGF